MLFCRFIFNYFEKYFSGINGELFSRSLREQLFAKQMVTTMQAFEKKESGSYLLRYSGDLQSAQNFLTKGIIGFIVDCLFIVLAIAFFLSINVELTIVVFFVFPLIFLVNHFLNIRLKKLTKSKRNTRSSNLAFVSSRLKAIATIKIYNREKIEQDKFNVRSEKLFGFGKKYMRLYALINALYSFLLYAMLGGILFTAYHIIQSGDQSIDGGTILTYIMLTISTIPVYKRILKVNTVWQAGDVSLRKLLLILNAEEEVRTNAEEVKLKFGAISIEHLSFGFNQKKPLFKDLSFEIPAHQISYITGQQGSGKSTLLKLLTGLYKYDQGSIRIDGYELNNMGSYALRKNLVLVSDELPLLGKTIFEVISYSRKEEKRVVAQKILNQLGMKIDQHENILSNPVKEAGQNLSAGQRKLLMIARALLTKKKIILLDEPFKDLELEYQERLSDILNDLKKKHTIVIITGENQNILNPDHIIHLNMPTAKPVLV
jgi:ABC-type multidrug transport system fused ATPase/permease subunit